jgi:hypothetical protein
VLVNAAEAATQPSAPVPPVAAQPVALLADHLSVSEPPGCIVAEAPPFAVNEIEGGPGGAGFTVTVTLLADPVPPGPVQVSV